MSHQEQTKVFYETFKGNQIFAIWNVDSNGEKVGKYPIISFGLKKATAIQGHLNELSTWIQDQSTPKKTGAIDLSQLSQLSPAEMQALLSQLQKQ